MIKKRMILHKTLAAIPPMNQYPSRKEWEAAAWERVLTSTDALRLLVTAHERRAIVMRAAALDRISSGKSYRDIGRELWLSPQTVSGIKKAVKEKIYRSYLERSKHERKKKVYHPQGAARKEKSFGIPRRTKYGTGYIRA